MSASDQVGVRVRDLRRRNGLSVEQLAERCGAAGIPLSTTALYLIEGGGRGKSTGRERRRVTVDELLVLAKALDVPAFRLLPEVAEPESAGEARVIAAVRETLSRFEAP